MGYTFEVEFEREDDGRWIAEIASLPGAMAYGDTKEEAASKAEAIALRVVADEIERERTVANSVQFAMA